MYQKRENIYLASSKLLPGRRHNSEKEEMLRRDTVEAVCNYTPQSQRGYEIGSPPFRSKEKLPQRTTNYLLKRV